MTSVLGPWMNSGPCAPLTVKEQLSWDVPLHPVPAAGVSDGPQLTQLESHLASLIALLRERELTSISVPSVACVSGTPHLSDVLLSCRKAARQVLTLPSLAREKGWPLL